MIKLLSSLFGLLNVVFTLFNNKRIGDAAIAKAKESAYAQEIQDMRADKDFADKLTPDNAVKLCDKLNNRP